MGQAQSRTATSPCSFWGETFLSGQEVQDGGRVQDAARRPAFQFHPCHCWVLPQTCHCSSQSLRLTKAVTTEPSLGLGLSPLRCVRAEEWKMLGSLPQAPAFMRPLVCGELSPEGGTGPWEG